MRKLDDRKIYLKGPLQMSITKAAAQNISLVKNCNIREPSDSSSSSDQKRQQFFSQRITSGETAFLHTPPLLYIEYTPLKKKRGRWFKAPPPPPPPSTIHLRTDDVTWTYYTSF